MKPYAIGSHYNFNLNSSLQGIPVVLWTSAVIICLATLVVLYWSGNPETQITIGCNLAFYEASHYLWVNKA